MSGFTPMRFSVGSTGLRYSFTPVEPITSNPAQLVEWRALSTLPGNRACGVAAAGSNIVAGVALWDIPAVRATVSTPQVGDANSLDVASYVVVPITFAANATRGQPLIAAAAGQVTPATGTPTFGQVIGFCAQDSVAASAVGLAFIKPSGA